MRVVLALAQIKSVKKRIVRQIRLLCFCETLVMFFLILHRGAVRLLLCWCYTEMGGGGSMLLLLLLKTLLFVCSKPVVLIIVIS